MYILLYLLYLASQRHRQRQSLWPLIHWLQLRIHDSHCSGDVLLNTLYFVTTLCVLFDANVVLPGSLSRYFSAHWSHQGGNAFHFSKRAIQRDMQMGHCCHKKYFSIWHKIVIRPLFSFIIFMQQCSSSSTYIAAAAGKFFWYFHSAQHWYHYSHSGSLV